MTKTMTWQTNPNEVHAVLRRWMLADGLPIVLDLESSREAFVVDARTGAEYLDLYSYFASQPVSHNHPGLADPAFRDRLLLAALQKPTNSDIYTQAMADFVATFARTVPPAFKHLFFIEGGALAVENALKVAFDWKVQKNVAAGRGEHLGTQVIHFTGAFHGRSGYTLSLTNTFSPAKTRHFPKFSWPRVTTPGRTFPETPESLARVAELERQALSEIEQALERSRHDVAALIIETIQGEGGDVHFRSEFLRALREICDREDVLLVFDEVQAGMGVTGRWWAFEDHGVQPDVFAFGKKTQVCGIAATDRVDEVESCFKVSSRINSTWGGNLTDMVRCTRFIELIEEHRLLDNARTTGAYLLERLRDVARKHPRVTNVRGAGLMCAFDLPDTAARDALKRKLLENRVLILPSGSRSLRTRPVLDFTREHVDLAVERIAASLEAS